MLVSFHPRHGFDLGRTLHKASSKWKVKACLEHFGCDRIARTIRADERKTVPDPYPSTSPPQTRRPSNRLRHDLTVSRHAD